MRVYLDTCCLNRPFDNQEQERIREETEAVRLVFSRIEHDGWEWIGSQVLTYEVSMVPDAERRIILEHWLFWMSTKVTIDESVILRAEDLKIRGFHTADALHIACAEKGAVDVMLTTDGQLLHLAGKCAPIIRMPIANPREWITGER
ncbi:MAG: type II toxin-antitoxin system VapC family toxin [Armatimonadetes bacterium]|jgi:predicted nucleic acid-binding protein|nr:type II toxin-antitoxin system VapC family toxin [Armatimonadota bacterium]